MAEWTLLFSVESVAVETATRVCRSVSQSLGKGEDFAHSDTHLLHVTVNSAKAPERSSYYTLTGISHAEVAAKINRYAATHPSVHTLIPCEDLSSAEVAVLASQLRRFIEKDIQQSLAEDDGRQIHMNPWEVSGEDEAYRDAQCAETMKLWAHHIHGSFKRPSMNATIPSLPAVNEFTKLMTARLLVNGTYKQSMSCVAGHTVKALEMNEQTNETELIAEDWPHWPYVTHYRALAYGPYPFWQFGPPPSSDWKFNESYSSIYKTGQPLEVWHNTFRKATKFYHRSCDMSLVGFDWLGVRPCVMLMFDAFGVNGTWYLYTADNETMASDGQFCCDSTWQNKNGLHLGTINRKFMDEMIFLETGDFEGEYYNGSSKKYILAMSLPGKGCPECFDEPVLPINVFYETDLKGRPLRFGEWGQNLSLHGYLRDIDLPLLYEEFDPESFANDGMQQFNDSVFDLPRQCLTDLFGCHPGRQSRYSTKLSNYT